MQILRQGLRNVGDTEFLRLLGELRENPRARERPLASLPTSAAAVKCLAELGLVRTNEWGKAFPLKWIHRFAVPGFAPESEDSLWTITDLPFLSPPPKGSHLVFPYQDEAVTLIDAIVASRAVQSLCNSRASRLRVLDMCTGSGAIALWIAKSFPDVEVVAVDIDPDAIEQAEENQRLNQIPNVTFRKGDLFKGLDEGSFDLIIADPPVRPSLPGTEMDSKMDSTSAGREGDSVTNAVLHAAFRHLKQMAGSRLLILGYSIGTEEAVGKEFKSETPDHHRLGRSMMDVKEAHALKSETLRIDGAFQHAGEFALRFMHCKALPNPCPLEATVLRLADSTRAEYICDMDPTHMQDSVTGYLAMVKDLIRSEGTHLHYVLGDFRLTDARGGPPGVAAR